MLCPSGVGSQVAWQYSVCPTSGGVADRVPSGVNNLLIVEVIAPGRITAILVKEQFGF